MLCSPELSPEITLLESCPTLQACNVYLFRAVVLLLDLFDGEQMEGIVPSNHNQAKCVDGNHLGEDRCCSITERARPAPGMQTEARQVESRTQIMMNPLSHKKKNIHIKAFCT